MHHVGAIINLQSFNRSLCDYSWSCNIYYVMHGRQVGLLSLQFKFASGDYEQQVVETWTSTKNMDTESFLRTELVSCTGIICSILMLKASLVSQKTYRVYER